MRSLSFALLSTLAFALSHPARGGEKVVILGDSLSKEYEFSFQLDGFADPDSVRNWIEILNAERNDTFDLGSRIEITVLFNDFFFRHEYNWAVPGAKIPQISSFLRGEIGFVDFFSSSSPSDFETVINLLALFLTEDDFAIADLDQQLRNTAERVVLFVGGNDIDEVYREIYEADPAFDSARWMEDFLGEAAFIMDWVLARNPTIEFVVVAFPHVGITPTVKSSHPTDPVKTARVTAVLRELNQALEALTRSRGIAFADIFEPMLRLLGDQPACIHGVPFINDIPPPDSDPGDLGYVWLNGLASDGFHPNTNLQATVANDIVRRLNETYNAGIPPLTATEILSDWLERDPDVSFTEWLACYGLAGAGTDDDSDLDGLPAGLEFGLGADPTRFDPWHVSFSRLLHGEAPCLELAYSVRLPGTSQVVLQPQSSVGLEAWHAAESLQGSDGRTRALLPLEDPHGFLRLRAEILSGPEKE